MQRDRFVAASTWLRNAQVDLEVATESGRYPSRACFRAQQAAQLALKALLIALTDDHPRSHIGDVLIRELQAAIRQARSVFTYAEQLVERLVLEGEGTP